MGQQLASFPENAQNLVISGAVSTALTVISAAVDEGPLAQFRSRDPVLTCVCLLRNLAKCGPVSG